MAYRPGARRGQVRGVEAPRFGRRRGGARVRERAATAGGVVSAAVALDLAANQVEARPRVSVVVSTRNHARYLGDTLRGFEAQAFADADLVVVDNASTDDTQSVMTEFLARTTRPVRYVRFAADQGPANGRNHGLGLARGEYVAFTDSDCVPSPQWLRTALDAFTSAEIGIVQGRTECAGDNAPMFSHFIETRRFDGSFSTSNVVYRRRALGDHAFDRACAYWEDTDLGCRVRCRRLGRRVRARRARAPPDRSAVAAALVVVADALTRTGPRRRPGIPRSGKRCFSACGCGRCTRCSIWRS